MTDLPGDDQAEFTGSSILVRLGAGATGRTATLTLTLTNPNAMTKPLGARLTDPYPAGMVNTSPPTPPRPARGEWHRRARRVHPPARGRPDPPRRRLYSQGGVYTIQQFLGVGCLKDTLNRRIQQRVEFRVRLLGRQSLHQSSRKARDNPMISAQSFIGFVPRVAS